VADATIRAAATVFDIAGGQVISPPPDGLDEPHGQVNGFLVTLGVLLIELDFTAGQLEGRETPRFRLSPTADAMKDSSQAGAFQQQTRQGKGQQNPERQKSLDHDLAAERERPRKGDEDDQSEQTTPVALELPGKPDHGHQQKAERHDAAENDQSIEIRSANEKSTELDPANEKGGFGPFLEEPIKTGLSSISFAPFEVKFVRLSLK
jgi:hypothetical protein